MSRTLVAGEPSPAPVASPRGFTSSGDPRHAAFEAELKKLAATWKPEHDVWSLFGEMWRLSQTRRELQVRFDRLTAQLAHPAARHHLRHAEADARYYAWQGKLRVMDEQAERLTAALAKAWGKVPVRTRAELQRHPGWSQATDAKTFAAEMWESAKRLGPWPAGEKMPFVLAGIAVMASWIAGIVP